MADYSDTYKTITKPAKGFYKDKGSKFYAFAYPVKNEEEVKEILDNLKKDYYDARHHCYAYAIGFNRELTRSNDDGEPSGTAGKPIYGQLLSHNITNVLVVVIRYFGGTKLGVRGLIDAYKTASVDALENSHIIVKKLKDIYEIHYDYPLMNKVMYLIKELNLEQIETKFETDCKIKFAVRKSDSEKVNQIFKKMYPLQIKYLYST